MFKDTYNPEQQGDFEHHVDSNFAMPAWLVAGIQIALLTAVGIGLHYWLNGSTNLIFILVSLFLSINLLICYWEICLFLRRDYIEKRNIYWREIKDRTGTDPAVTYLSAKVSCKNLFSPTFWADVWATYSLYDGSRMRIEKPMALILIRVMALQP